LRGYGDLVDAASSPTAMCRLDPATAVRAIAERLPVTMPTPRVNVEIVAMVSAKAVTHYEQPPFEAALQPARSVLAETKFSVTQHTTVGLPPQEIQTSYPAPFGTLLITINTLCSLAH
jgi:hypothetical protein